MKKLIALILVLSLALSLTGCKMIDYKKAVSAMEEGRYAEAAATLETLTDYKDSAELLNKCHYVLAERTFDAKEYADAKAAFQALGDYKDSANYVKKCDYNLALNAYEDKDYQQALEIFQTLNGYSDSDRYITECENAILSAKLEGQWESDVVDLTPSILTLLAQTDEELADLLAERGSLAGMTVSVTFGEAGFCTQSGSYVNLDNLMVTFEDILRAYSLAEIEAALAADNFTLQDLYNELGTDDLDEIYLQLFGYSITDLMDAYALDEMLNSMMESLTMECTYVIKDGTIHCNSDEFHYDAETDTLTTEVDEASAALLGFDSLSLHRK